MLQGIGRTAGQDERPWSDHIAKIQELFLEMAQLDFSMGEFLVANSIFVLPEMLRYKRTHRLGTHFCP